MKSSTRSTHETMSNRHTSRIVVVGSTSMVKDRPPLVSKKRKERPSPDGAGDDDDDEDDEIGDLLSGPGEFCLSSSISTGPPGARDAMNFNQTQRNNTLELLFSSIDVGEYA